MSEEIDIISEIEAIADRYDDWGKRLDLYIAARDHLFDRLTREEIDKSEYVALCLKVSERERALIEEMGRVQKDIETRVEPSIREMIKKAEAENRKPGP